MAQWLVEGLTATISGVLTVFIVLILIALVIGSLQYLINPKKTMELVRQKRVKKNDSVTKETMSEDREAVDEVAIDMHSEQDELELVAVITATIAASLNVSSDQLMVRSIRRVDETKRWHRRS